MASKRRRRRSTDSLVPLIVPQRKGLVEDGLTGATLFDGDDGAALDVEFHPAILRTVDWMLKIDESERLISVDAVRN